MKLQFVRPIPKLGHLDKKVVFFTTETLTARQDFENLL